MARTAPANATDKLSAAQIAWYAQQAGFSGPDLATAVAVALSESGGRINATHTNSGGSTDYGLWQINDKAHPDLITADAQWWVAGFNAQMAFKVYQKAGNSFSPWSVFKSGAYLAHLPAAKIAAGNPQSSGLVQAGPDTVTTNNPISDLLSPLVGLANAAKTIAGSVFKATAWSANPHNWVRVAFIGIGGVLVVSSLAVIAKPYVMGAAAPIVGAAADIAPGGGAIKKVAKVAASKGAKGAK